MSITSKKFFIVLDRNLKDKKNLLFNVNFFYLKSFKKKSFTFSYISDPFFRGTVIFGLDFKNKMRPLLFNKIEKDGSIIPVDPRLFKRFLISPNNKFIAFSNQTSLQDLEPIKKMMSKLQIDTEKIANLTLCASCLEKDKFAILSERSQIKSFRNQIICSDCAYNIILKEAKITGLIESDHINPKLKNFLQHMILKFKEVKRVITAFKADFNPILNKDLTLYDIEKSPSISKKYLDYKIENLNTDSIFKKILKDLNISTLLPIQAISIEKGLLSEYHHQLIMAPTSAGKTLVGELAGITKILKDKSIKMLYLVPIVALANIRTEDFKSKYKSLNLKIIKRVGESLFEKKVDDNIEDLNDANIIIATYEAVDYILRSGNKEKLGNVGNLQTIIVDEIQTLIDLDRGFLLDGFIARLKMLFNKAQFLYLSATVGEPKLLAHKLNSMLISYNNRPVPIERHLLLCLNDTIKQKFIAQIVKDAFFRRSQYGYKGQSIIFTNTRKKCEALALHLQEKGILVKAYHSGLTNEERKVIENEFQHQEIAGVIATAALAAGVDLPARIVIFESLAMGINWLTVAEFEQMLGRAGRLKKHELGYAYLLVEPGKIYSPKMKETEENIAIKLLNGKIKDFELPPNEDKSITEVLSFISMFIKGIDKKMIHTYFSYLVNNNFDLEKFLRKLNNLGLIRVKEDFTYKATQLGRAIANSFLTVDQCLEIVEIVNKNERSIIEIALNLKPIRNIYLSRKVVADLAKNVNLKYFSNNLFSGSVLSLMNAESIKKRKKFSSEFIEFIMKLIKDIFNCKCKDNPYCDCGRLNLEKIIISLRIENKMQIEEICNYLEEVYKIVLMKGDLINFLEDLIHSLESIKDIIEGLLNLKENYKIELSEIPKIIEQIKY